LLLVEAKNHLPKDFLIRQIYYPYRLWRNRVSKKVVSVFMTYSNDEFRFFEYDFLIPEDYNSLQLIRQKKYRIAAEDITISDIKSILDNVELTQEPKVPFPQADKFERVIDLMGLLVDKSELDIQEITANYDFDKRQTDYYANA
jgi:Domain of unknown function (DUF6997)